MGFEASGARTAVYGRAESRNWKRDKRKTPFMSHRFIRDANCALGTNEGTRSPWSPDSFSYPRLLSLFGTRRKAESTGTVDHPVSDVSGVGDRHQKQTLAEELE